MLRGGASGTCSKPTAGEDCMLGTSPGVFDRTGFTGNDENGPPGAEPRLGGRPRILPVIDPEVLGHAEETAGPCRLRLRDFSPVEGVSAERGSTTEGCSVWWFLGIYADRGKPGGDPSPSKGLQRKS